MQNWYSTLFHLSLLNRRYFYFTERSLDFQKSQKALTSISLSSRCSVSPAARRTPPVDLVHGASAAKWTREALQRHLARPLAPSHADTRPKRSPEPPRRPAMQLAAYSLHPLAVESPKAKSTTPRRYSPHPGAPWPISTP